MKKIIVFTVIACLMATSMAFAKKTKKAKKPKAGYAIVELDKAKKAKKSKKAAKPKPEASFIQE